MNVISKEQRLDDESLLTLMCEVESGINGRPLTKVPYDPNDWEAVAVHSGIQGIHRIPWCPPNNFFSVAFDISFSIPSFKIHCHLLLFYIRIFLSDFVYEYEASIEQWP